LFWLSQVFKREFFSIIGANFHRPYALPDALPVAVKPYSKLKAPTPTALDRILFDPPPEGRAAES